MMVINAYLLGLYVIFSNFVIDNCLGLIMYIGDGFCDDDNNNEYCGYDGNDCCLEDVKTNFCTICQCIEGKTN